MEEDSADVEVVLLCTAFRGEAGVGVEDVTIAGEGGEVDLLGVSAVQGSEDAGAAFWA